MATTRPSSSSDVVVVESLSTTDAVIRVRKVPSPRRRRDGLLQYARDNTSQNGEDGILHRLFQLLPSQAPSSPSHHMRVCVDVGAWDGIHLSNTRSLLQNDVGSDNATSSCSERWYGVLIEADPLKFDQLVKLYRDDDDTTNHNNTLLLNRTISVVDPQHNPNSLHGILQQQQPQFANEFMIDFLCIDIDGPDYHVLADLFHFSPYRPMVICIEFNPTMPHDLIYIPPRSDSERHGASLAALVELALANDYVLVETTLYNAFFVRKVEYEQYLIREVPDTSIEALHEHTMGTSLYQLYDGTLKLWGCKRMLWHRMPMDEDKLQMIPASSRIFPFAPSTTTTTGNVTDEPFDMSEVVDLSPYCQSTKPDARRQDCASKLYAQLQKDGFALICGTGIDQRVCHQVLKACHDFLQLADEDVRRSCLAVDRARRGYSPMNGENFASLLGEKGPNDLVRKFRIGPPNLLNEIDAYDDGSLFQPNVWPSESWDLAAAFQSALEEYYDAACSSVKSVVAAICDGLLHDHPDLRESVSPLMTEASNDPTSDRTTSILTLLGYRVGTRHKGKNKGPLVAAHTDVGVITMLIYDGLDTCAALQRSDGKGGWVNIELPQKVPSDPVFVVNVADLLSDLSHQRLPSTLHRVVARSGSSTPRNCCALFVGLDARTQLNINGNKMTYQEWRKQRIAKSQIR